METVQTIFNKLWDHYVVKKNPPAFIKEKEPNHYRVFHVSPSGAKDPIAIFMDLQKHDPAKLVVQPLQSVIIQVMQPVIVEADIPKILGLFKVAHIIHDASIFTDNPTQYFQEQFTLMANQNGLTIPVEEKPAV